MEAVINFLVVWGATAAPLLIGGFYLNRQLNELSSKLDNMASPKKKSK
jgi:hypothetical protein|tara:strand:- start:945 stop:1088 length:144 start_codon:yes stop_codon:yes gene_type:complete